MNEPGCTQPGSFVYQEYSAYQSPHYREYMIPLFPSQL